MSSTLEAKAFQDEEAAYAWVETRVWPGGPICPHCGCLKEHVGKLKGKTTRPGLYKCYGCRKPFTVKIGTVFESSHVPMRLWLQAMHLMCSSKKGISSNQLHRTLGVTLKTAWFMSHRIRLAMQQVGLEPMGGFGEIVEADETYIGRIEGQPKGKAGFGHKNAVVTLVERDGSARSFHVDRASIASIAPIVRENISREATLMTDEAQLYRRVGEEYASHGTVQHAKEEYVRYDGEYVIHTNTVEGFFSIFKRGMKGIYQHCSEKHLHRYLAEFDFRYSNRVRLGVNDAERTGRAVKGIVGKRLTYTTPHN